VPTKKRATQLNRDIAEALSRPRAHAKMPMAQLYVEGVGHRLPHGYEVHWTWTARRDGKKIDGGALTGGDLPEFYETWPAAHVQGIVDMVKRMVREEWIAAGEFGALKLSPDVHVTLTKSGSEVPIRPR
jgi:hypothetical protein